MKKVCVSYDEWRLIVHALNRLRNDLISEGHYTDTVDDALMVAMKAKSKWVKVAG